MSFKHCIWPSIQQLIEKFRFCKEKDIVDSLITTSGYIKTKVYVFGSKLEVFE